MGPSVGLPAQPSLARFPPPDPGDPLQLPSAAGAAPAETGRSGRAAAASSPLVCRYNLWRKHEARPPGRTGTIPPVPPASRNSSAGTAAESHPLKMLPELRKGRDNINVAAKWRPTTGAKVSGTDSDPGPTRAHRRPPGVLDLVQAYLGAHLSAWDRHSGCPEWHQRVPGRT